MMIYKKLMFVMLILAIVIGGCKNIETPQSNARTFDITFETIAQSDGTTNNVQTEQQQIITSKEKWEELWNTIHETVEPKPTLPRVDFSRNVVLAVFQGMKGSGGYTIEVTKIVDSFPDDVRIVSVREISPGEGSMVKVVITSPYHIIEMPWPGDETTIEFKIEQETYNWE